MKIAIVLAFATLAVAKQYFDGDQVLTLYPKVHSHLTLLREFDSYDTLADFWNPDNIDAVKIGRPVDIRFKSHNLRAIKKKLDAAKIEYEIKINDLQALINYQFDVDRSTRAYNYNVYHTYDEINKWTKDTAAAYPTLARQSVLTKSYEGREIPMLTLGSSPNNPMVLIDCGIHAREWISPAVCQCYVDRMLSSYGSDAGVTNTLDTLTIVVLPVLNPDGYEYTWANDRMWRKTRSNYGTRCYGVDPNRNFDANWAGPGSSSSPCSDTYYGPSMASEPLTQGFQNFVESNDGKIMAYITFHSYGQVYIFPYSYAVKDVDNFDEHNNLAIASVNAAYAVHRKSFTYGPGYESMYLAAGGSDDFSKDNGVKLSYTIELRDTGRYGFVLPENQIQPSCEEMYPAIDVITQHVVDNYA